MSSWKVWFAALAAMSFATVAHSASCSQLERQLRSAGGGGTAAYDRSISRQNQQIERVRSVIRRTGCRAGSSFGTCGTFTRSLKAMRANLAELKAQRRRRGKRASKASIRRQMKRQGCGTRPARKRSELERQVFGTVRARAAKKSRPSSVRLARTAPSEPTPNRSRGGTYKTMCVRTCDGLALPVSLATTADRFAGDEAACAAMCPGTPTALYAMPVRSEDMSLAVHTGSGASYPELSTAFSFRKAYNPGCSCRFDRNLLDEALTRPVEAQVETTLARSAIIIPTPRPRRRKAVAVAAPVERADAPIRIVGEAFLPAPE